MSETLWKPRGSDFKRAARALHKKYRSNEYWSYQEIPEIRVRAIAPILNVPGVSVIGASIVGELQDFTVILEVGTEDVQSEDCKFKVTDADYICIVQTDDWLAKYIRTTPKGKAADSTAKAYDTRVESDVTSAEEILAELENEGASPESTREMVLEAEVTPFDGAQTARLNAALRRFIQSRRTSEDPNDLIVVTSAIRKYVTTMDRDELGSLALLLDAQHNVPVPLEVELEVTKTLVRKLSSHPPDESDPEPELADRLREIAETYLKERLLSREKYGAIALNAILALALLRSGHMSDLAPALKNLRSHWFTELVLRRATRIEADLMQRFPGAQAERYVACLRAVCNELT